MDAPQARGLRLHTKWRQEFLHRGRLVDVLAEDYLVGISEILHPRRNVDGLPEIVEPVVQSDGNRRALVHPDLQK